MNFASMLKFTAMPQFVIEREIPGAGSLTEDQIREVSLHSLETLKSMGPHIQWLHSYVTEDKVYCVYVAPDEETIREHARKVEFAQTGSLPCAGLSIPQLSAR